MHEGDMSAGSDETATAEKSEAQRKRGLRRLPERWTYRHMKGNQINRYQGRELSQRSQIVDDCSHPLAWGELRDQ